MSIPTPLVSIIIPCYNYGRYLAEAIQSAIEQTYSNIEILVVDDGSNDNTLEVANAFEDKIAYIYKVNGGLSSARNAGLKSINGEYVIFLDADDILDPNYVKKTLSEFLKSDREKLGFVFTQMKLFGRENKVTKYPQFDFDSFILANYAHASAMMRSDLLAHYHYDENLKTGWEDWDMYLQLIENGYNGVLVDEPLLYYRKHEGDNSMADDLNDALKISRLRLKIMRKHSKLYARKFYFKHLFKTQLFILKIQIKTLLESPPHA